MHSCKLNPRFLIRFTTLLIRSKRNLCAPVLNEKQSNYQLSVPVLNEENEIIDHSVEYPTILDLSRSSKKRAEREAWHTKIKKLSTVEEKIFELNMPKYYGWRLYKIQEGTIPYNSLPQTQYITRTHIVNESILPSYYDNILNSETLDTYVQQIKSHVEDMLIFEYTCRKQNYQFNSDQIENKMLIENFVTKSISQQINRILTINLSSNYPHLLETQVDVEPRIEAFWCFGGFDVPVEVRKAREGRSWTKEWKDERVNQYLQYYGKPTIQLRHNLPLKEIISMEESEDSSLEIPVFPYDPRNTEYFPHRERATIIPGFWPGENYEFGLISYHNRGHLQERPANFDDHLDAIKTQAVFGSFSWLYAQACYQGFSTFQDPTYPLVNQLVITNGQTWSFSVYQLNTTTMHIDCFDKNQRKNMCWITEPMKLFDSIEDGKIHGFNDDVLKNLIKFYVNAPAIRKGVEMKPYLGKEKVIADIEDPERRVWLEDKYKYLTSKRSRHRLYPEIYHWQKIYLIDHKTRPLDKKFEPWEFGINLYNRRLDDHTPEYIPKCKRAYPKSKKKWAKTYYPSVRDDNSSS